MQWYTAGILDGHDPSRPPPAYLEERLSDLHYALELSVTSPSESKTVLRHIADRLAEHKDDDFTAPVAEAIKRMGDSPAQSREIIKRIMAEMLDAKDAYDEHERSSRWRKKKTTSQ